jgi:predicted Na+-dependent transporter
MSHSLEPSPIIAVSLLLLALSPDCGISNKYWYLARCDVFPSTAITALSAVFSLFTVAIILDWVPVVSSEFSALVIVPIEQIIMQLLFLMVLPKRPVGLICKVVDELPLLEHPPAAQTAPLRLRRR